MRIKYTPRKWVVAHQWHRWYAWKPVRVEGEWVWLEYVYRKCWYPFNAVMDGPVCIYRLDDPEKKDTPS